jgi:hypothetical protein
MKECSSIVNLSCTDEMSDAIGEPMLIKDQIEPNKECYAVNSL